MGFDRLATRNPQLHIVPNVKTQTKNELGNLECMTKDFDELEDWEEDYNLINAENWPGLLEFRRKKALKRPSDLHAQEAYAEALNLNKKHRETIDFLRPLYAENWDIGFGISVILDALYAQGKTEDDFDWIKKPEILKLDHSMIGFCREQLINKRKPYEVWQLHTAMIMKFDYVAFNESELVAFIFQCNEIFEISGEGDHFSDLKVKLKRK